MRFQGCFKLIIYLIYLVGFLFAFFALTELVLSCRYFTSSTGKSSGNTWESVEGTGFSCEQQIVEIMKEEGQVTWGVGRYVPYVEWRRKPFSGLFINIDEKGLRKTYNRPCDDPIVIHVYGGSTVWGSAVDDESTIPSFLSRYLQQEGGLCVEVVNYGEGGYVTSQDLNCFVENIRENKTPDLAIFYFGINDAYATCGGVFPGFHGLVALMEERLNPENNGRYGLAKRLLVSTCIFSSKAFSRLLDLLREADLDQ